MQQDMSLTYNWATGVKETGDMICDMSDTVLGVYLPCFGDVSLSVSPSLCLSDSLSLSLWYVIMMCSSFYLNVCQVD